MRLYLADLVDIAAGHGFEPAIDRRTPVETGGLQTEDGLIGAEMSSQGTIEQDVAFGGVHEKKRRPIAGWISGTMISGRGSPGRLMATRDFQSSSLLPRLRILASVRG